MAHDAGLLSEEFSLQLGRQEAPDSSSSGQSPSSLTSSASVVLQAIGSHVGMLKFPSRQIALPVGQYPSSHEGQQDSPERRTDVQFPSPPLRSISSISHAPSVSFTSSKPTSWPLANLTANSAPHLSARLREGAAPAILARRMKR
eukprot:CAMPEP_0117495464 /NCGR_PEP_ID=MMETSP0784-20121206/20146_1 /TAXON_ID=39447 /ORGANISM="" /LENGTH=144 /DNA_ID=CAMNT_0005290387 /DNA_START=1040 /DNA_END=1471 /DNA_ORIENTATION=-